ncbi:MAG: NnrS family protein [Phycisphaerae bacterium]|nr:NnrS family protein [Phycisphaerae bacterium]
MANASPAPPATPAGAVFVGMPGGFAAKPRAADVLFLRDAFRPFYLFGTAFAAIAIPLWLAMWYRSTPMPSMPPLYWHTHEMLFGFAGAIIVGFLLTAARNWTGLPLPSGIVLGGMVALWIAARLANFFAHGVVGAVVDVLLFLLVAVILARALLRSGNCANWPIVGVLILLTAANALFHASILGAVSIAPITTVEAGLMLVVVLILIIGGRVVPGFTANAIAGGRSLRRPRLHAVATIITLVAFAADLFGAEGAWICVPALGAAGLLAAETFQWQAHRALRQPLLRVLHLSYVWIPLGLFLFALASIGIVPRTAAMHAFAVGALGGMILGMVVRTGMAHAGVAVVARRWELLAFMLIPAAAFLRLLSALVPAGGASTLTLSGAAWTAAFLAYLAGHTRMLAFSRRCDG